MYIIAFACVFSAGLRSLHSIEKFLKRLRREQVLQVDFYLFISQPVKRSCFSIKGFSCVSWAITAYSL